MIIFKFPLGPYKTNAILLGCPQTKKAAVIDPALGATDIVIAKAAENGLTIEKILLTHSHWDHFADAKRLKDELNIPLYVHPLDAENLEHPGADGIPLMITIQPVKPDSFLKEGEVVEVGHLKLEVIHTPGHSPGGVCFYLAEQKLVIVGDTFFRGSIGSLHFPCAQPELMWQSLRKLAKLPPDTRVISGHGEETTIGRESWLNRAEEIFS